MRKSPELLAGHYTKENSRERGGGEQKLHNVNSRRVASLSTIDMKKTKDMNSNERLWEELTTALLFHVEKKVLTSHPSLRSHKW